MAIMANTGARASKRPALAAMSRVRFVARLIGRAAVAPVHDRQAVEFLDLGLPRHQFEEAGDDTHAHIAGQFA